MTPSRLSQAAAAIPPLAVRLREAGVYVIGAGDQEASESFQNACDLFLHISAAPEQPPTCPPEEDAPEEEDARDSMDTPPEDAGTAAEESGGADDMDRIHHLLRLIWRSFRRKAGYVTVTLAGSLIRDAKPDFSYGFEELSRLIQACPDRYEVSRSDAGGFLYKCIDFEEVSRAEEAANSAADGIDRIHHLLRRACDLYRQADGYTFMTDAGKFIKKVKPAFDPNTYGFGTLLQLVQSYSDRYEVIKNAAGTLLYQCITPEEENRAEAVQMQEAPQEIACVGTEE